jgi:hypothetical protein
VPLGAQYCARRQGDASRARIRSERAPGLQRPWRGAGESAWRIGGVQRKALCREPSVAAVGLHARRRRVSQHGCGLGGAGAGGWLATAGVRWPMRAPAVTRCRRVRTLHARQFRQRVESPTPVWPPDSHGTVLFERPNPCAGTTRPPTNS